MIDLPPPFRRAVADDAPELAELANIAGHGVPLIFWTEMAEDGEDPWDVGRRRMAKQAVEQELVVAEIDGRAVATLIGYAIGSEPQEIGPDFPAMFRPLQELENLALDSWYINMLAAFPAYRDRGLGGRLLNIADGIGRGAGVTKMSVIVADGNPGARRLYKRHGYIKQAWRPCVAAEGWNTGSARWDLLVKAL